MPGAFGLLSDPHPSHFPADRLVENRARFDAHKLNRIGAFTEGTITKIAWSEHGNPYQLARQTPNILVNGNPKPVLVVWDELGRAWFECPACHRRCKHIYFDGLACRICCRLDYASRHLHRSVSGVHRIVRWRRMIGIDPHPFAPIPKRQRHHKRYHRIVARILLEERALLGHLQTVTHDLERRARLRGMIPK
jgi:hypothetical protein